MNNIKNFSDFINESQEINEGTRSQFGKIDRKGNITSVYMHYDGYPENVLPILKRGYKGGKNVDAVIAKGEASGLEADMADMNFYDDGETPLTEKSKQWMMAGYGERELSPAGV